MSELQYRREELTAALPETEQSSSKTKNYLSTYTPMGPGGDTNVSSRGGLHNIQTKGLDEAKDAPLRRTHDMSKDSPVSRRGQGGDPLSTGSDKRSGLGERGLASHSERGAGHSERGGSPQKTNSGYIYYSSRDPSNGRDSRGTSAGGRGESRTTGGRRDIRSFDSVESMQDDGETQHPSTSLERHYPLNPSSGTVASTEVTDENDGGIMEEPGGYQTDWETSFALVSTARPPPSHGSAPEASGAVTELQQDWGGGSGEGSGRARTAADGPFRMVLDDDPRAVDSLHVEIQRLQARIMNRLNSPSQGEVNPKYNP